MFNGQRTIRDQLWATTKVIMFTVATDQQNNIVAAICCHCGGPRRLHLQCVCLRHCSEPTKWGAWLQVGVSRLLFKVRTVFEKALQREREKERNSCHAPNRPTLVPLISDGDSTCGRQSPKWLVCLSVELCGLQGSRLQPQSAWITSPITGWCTLFAVLPFFPDCVYAQLESLPLTKCPLADKWFFN